MYWISSDFSYNLHRSQSTLINAFMCVNQNYDTHIKHVLSFYKNNWISENTTFTIRKTLKKAKKKSVCEHEKLSANSENESMTKYIVNIIIQFIVVINQSKKQYHQCIQRLYSTFKRECNSSDNHLHRSNSQPSIDESFRTKSVEQFVDLINQQIKRWQVHR